LRATRVDVARAAGVSTTTVTNVLNDRKNVSDSVKQKVLKIMKELDYRPNLIARSLVTNKSKHVVVLLDDISDTHFGGIVSAFHKAAYQNGYFVSVFLREKMSELVDSFSSRGIEGVFMMISPVDGSSNRENADETIRQIEIMSELGIKVVSGFNCYHDLSKFSTIECDYGGAVTDAVKYLISLGHKEIGLLNIFDADYRFDNRYHSFKKAMKQFLDVDEPSVVFGQYPYPGYMDTGEEYTQQLLKKNPNITAIIGTNDLISLGCVSYLTSHGYNVPEDISVISLGGVPITQHFRPALTTMSLDFEGYGTAAFNMLQDCIKTGNTHLSLYKLSLNERDTTCKVKKSKTKQRGF